MGQALLNELGQKYDLDTLAMQLADVVDIKNPVKYMEHNINWEIDSLLEPTANGNADAVAQLFALPKSEDMKMDIHLIKRFRDWMERSLWVKKTRKVLCSSSDKIKSLIDEEAGMKKILEYALVALASAVGIAAINPMILSILVGLLATMILNGVDQFCGI